MLMLVYQQLCKGMLLWCIQSNRSFFFLDLKKFPLRLVKFETVQMLYELSIEFKDI